MFFSKCFCVFVLAPPAEAAPGKKSVKFLFYKNTDAVFSNAMAHFS